MGTGAPHTWGNRTCVLWRAITIAMTGPTLHSKHNLVFQCAFYIVWSPKYRRSVLVPPVDERLKTILVEVIQEHTAWLQALEVMPDRLHLLVKVDLQSGVHRLVKELKGLSSRLLRQEFPH